MNTSLEILKNEFTYKVIIASHWTSILVLRMRTSYHHHFCFLIMLIYVLFFVFFRGNILPFPLRFLPVHLTAQLRSSHPSAALLHQPRGGVAQIPVSSRLIKP